MQPALRADGTMIYFAYGSNIDPFQMRMRCRRSTMLGAARLDGFRLCFPRYSRIRESAVASIEPADDGVVWGALYEVPDEDQDRLDACEGYHPRRPVTENAYNRMEIDARPVEGATMRAITYAANAMAYAGAPSYEYLEQIIRGAMTLSFPEDYIETLRNWPRPETALIHHIG